MGSETKNALSTMVSASGFEVSATNHTPWPWPSPWLASNRAARGSFRMLQCAFCCCCYFFSEQPQGPNLNAYLQSASMLVFWLGQECDFESDGLILPTCPASVSSMAVWGCGFLEEERKGVWGMSEHISCTSTPWSSSVRGTGLQLVLSPQNVQVLSISCSATLPTNVEVAFRCNFHSWLKLSVQVSKVSNPFLLGKHLNTDLSVSLYLCECVWV